MKVLLFFVTQSVTAILYLNYNESIRLLEKTNKNLTVFGVNIIYELVRFTEIIVHNFIGTDVGHCLFGYYPKIWNESIQGVHTGGTRDYFLKYWS